MLRQNVHELIETVQLNRVQPLRELIKRLVPEFQDGVALDDVSFPGKTTKGEKMDVVTHSFELFDSRADQGIAAPKTVSQ